MKKKWLKRMCAAFLITMLSLLLYPVGRGYLREWTFDSENCSDAEAAVMAFAAQSGTPYRYWPESLITLLERNPETEDFVLSYPAEHRLEPEVDLSDYLDDEGVPLFLQWDKRWGYLQYGSDVAGLTGCGPVCLSMAAFYLTGDVHMSPDNMLRFALAEGYCSPGNGSSWTLISEGAQKLGLTATELPLVKNLILRHLEAGDPIICVMGPGDFTSSGHYIVLTGVEDGLLCVNDPNSLENSEKRWDYDHIYRQIRNLWVLRKA